MTTENVNWVEYEKVIDTILQYKVDGVGSRTIGKYLGIGKSTVNKYYNYYLQTGNKQINLGSRPKIHNKAKVLFLDLEVSASIVAAFSMFKHFSTPDHVIQFPYILSYAYNWLHEDVNDVYGRKLDDYETFKQDHHSDYELTCELWKLVDEADIICIQNEGFDSGWFTQRFAYHGLPQPSPFRVVCTLKGLKKAMTLPSNSLDYSTRYFGIEFNKIKHEGISLWIKCMDGDKDALARMLQYNIGDIPTLRELYLKIRAFIPNHPNVSLFGLSEEMTCSVCGSDNLTEIEDKFAFTNLSKFPCFRCNDCGTVKRGSKSLTTKEQRELFLRNITK